MSAFTPRRVGFALVMLSMLAAGLSTGARFYYLLFLVMAAMLVLGAASALWTLFTLKLDMQGVKRRVTRGGSMMTVFTVRHGCPLPVSAILVELSVPSSYAPSQLVNVSAPPFTTRRFRQVIRCPHRGMYRAGVTRLSVTDIFGMLTFSRRPRTALIPLEVQPRVGEAAPLILGAADMGPEYMSRSVEDNASPSDIRKWVSGDELKKIHWKLSLRKRELLVRTYEEAARPDTLIIPDLTEMSALKDQQLTLEDAVCEACLASARAQLEAGYPVRMPLTAARPQELSGQTALDLPAFQDALLRVKFDSPYGYEQVLTLMLGRLQRTGGAVLVTARLTTRIADMALRMQRSGIVTKLIWVVDDAPEAELQMLERLKMGGVRAEQLDPWAADARAARKKAAAAALEDEYDEGF